MTNLLDEVVLLAERLRLRRWVWICLLVQVVLSLLFWREAFHYGADRTFALEVLDGRDPYATVACMPGAPPLLLDYLGLRMWANVALFGLERLTGMPWYLLAQWCGLVLALYGTNRLTDRGDLPRGADIAVGLLTTMSPAFLIHGFILLGDVLSVLPWVFGVALAVRRSLWLGALLAGLAFAWSVPLLALGLVALAASLTSEPGHRARSLGVSLVAWCLGASCGLLPLSMELEQGVFRWYLADIQGWSGWSVWAMVGGVPFREAGHVALLGACAGLMWAVGTRRLKGVQGILLAGMAPFLLAAHCPPAGFLVVTILWSASRASGVESIMVALGAWVASQAVTAWLVVNDHWLEGGYAFLVPKGAGLTFSSTPSEAVGVLCLYATILMAWAMARTVAEPRAESET